jgi:lysophospholipase L1-like esterase
MAGPGGASKVRAVVIAAALALLVVGASSAHETSYPNSMDALGDSITRAFGTCPETFVDCSACPNPYSDCPEFSWSTGTSTVVDSVYLRLLALNPGISGHEYNDAVSGSKMAQLNGQASIAVSRRVELVTILMGGNDACTPSVSTMTPTATFQSQFQQAMNTLTTGLPNAEVRVGSLPNAYRLWELFHANSEAIRIWGLASICQSLLANPTSTAPADVARRAQVRAREEEYDAALQAVCAGYTQCKFDNDAGFNTMFGTRDVSHWDYFHPNIAGQSLIAFTAWNALGF